MHCKKIVNAIENLGQTEIDELFKLLHKNKCAYTRNNNGVFVNLAWLSNEMLQTIDNYIQFCIESQSEIRRMEEMCTDVASALLSKESKAVTENKEQNQVHSSTRSGSSGTSTGSSTMKFYLLKKKYAKLAAPQQGLSDELSYDRYIDT